uniref:Uncharacterized protein n=1 Tax=Arundo donax TaxID=35708 RepID=A0A0A9B4H5_ARUDO
MAEPPPLLLPTLQIQILISFALPLLLSIQDQEEKRSWWFSHARVRGHVESNQSIN